MVFQFLNLDENRLHIINAKDLRLVYDTRPGSRTPYTIQLNDSWVEVSRQTFMDARALMSEEGMLPLGNAERIEEINLRIEND